MVQAKSGQQLLGVEAGMPREDLGAGEQEVIQGPFPECKLKAFAVSALIKEGDALVSETVNSLVAPGGTLWNKASVFRDDNGAVIGAIETIRDISDRKQQEEEREKLIQELQKALSEIRKLSGMLPICASCKKIRDDTGYWNQVEAYLTSHSDVQFSHGICPECARKLYPEYDDVMYPEERGARNAEGGAEGKDKCIDETA